MAKNSAKAKPAKRSPRVATKSPAKPKPSLSRSSDKEKDPRYIVGIGSSAGGLEALRALFGAFEEIPAMAFVVVQHLAPQHRSRLVEIIAHSTKLKVKEAVDGDLLESRVVYITPPNRDVFLSRDRLVLKVPQLTVGPKPSVDLFFRSLAEEAGSRAIGVILSGTGSDGSHGVRAIKAAGGFTLCQKIESAKYDGMPKAAKYTGAIDMELTPEQIASELNRFHGLKKRKIPKSTLETDPYEEILDVVERNVGASFSLYKQSTVRRRMDRRMIATHCDSLGEYLEYLSRSPDEAKNLFQDILISVTSFFRDPGSFKALGRAIEEKVSAKPAGGTIRCWVIGCATGEEVYSIAILINEAMAKLEKRLSVQIFASDLDENALAIARKGVYSRASFEDFPSVLREKYFVAFEDRFQVKSTLRDGIVFSRHNICEDPPFQNMDLVSCRNVLIYFNHLLQEKVFRMIHYSLAPEGILFLGRSEAASANAGGMFDMKDKLAKIYVRAGGKGSLPRSSIRLNSIPEASSLPAAEPNLAANASNEEFFQSMIKGFAPDSVLVDEEFKLKSIYGRASSFLSFPKGDATTAIVKLVAGEVAIELSTLLHRSSQKNASAHGRSHEVKIGRELWLLQLAVAPLSVGGKKNYLVAFQTRPMKKAAPGEPRKKLSAPAEKRIQSLERELSLARAHLQTVVEQQETNSEELQSLNEELQSANEELQSSNEELETTNEEMQSSNEELTTVNQELNVKSAELSVLNQRLQAIQNAIVYPLLIIDKNLHIVNFNPSARHLLRVTESDVGAHMRAVPTGIDLAPITQTVESAMKRQSDDRIQYRAKDRTFEVQIQVYRGEKGEVEGAVISFVENTEIANALEESKLIKGRLASILDHTPAMVTMKDMSGVYMYVNQQFGDLMGAEGEDLVGQTDDEIFGEERAREIRARDYEVLKQEKPVQFEETLDLGGQVRFWTSAKFPLLDSRKRPYSVCTISLEITERVGRERQLELFRRAISSANNGTIILEDRGEGFTTTFCSSQFSVRLGIEPSRLLGAGLPKLFQEMRVQDRPEILRENIELLESEPFSTFTVMVPSESGEELILEVRGSMMRHPKDTLRHLILSIFDVSQRTRDQQTIAAQQEELTKFGRFSSLGEVAAGIAHEINTPLNVITTKTDMLRKAVELKRLKDDTVIRVADDIERMAKSISSVVLGLKSAVGMEPEKFESATVQNLVRDTLKICEYRLQRFGVEVKLHLPDEPVQIECFPVQVIQILINLINNSVDAIADLPDRWISLSLGDSKKAAEIVVSDSGSGIDPGLAEKIMTPFFTTKKDKKGTGIGLSLSRSIARRHNGDLVLDLQKPHTTFRLELAKRHE